MCANSGTLCIYTHDTHCMYLTWLRKRFALILQGEMERITSKCWSPAWRPGPLLEKVEIQLLNFKRIQGQGWRCQNRMIFIRVRIYFRAHAFSSSFVWLPFRLSVTGTTERVCLITGTVDAIMEVMEFIMDKIREKPDLTSKTTVDFDSGKATAERDKQV